MASIHPRIQVTLDPELAGALDEVGGGGPRSKAVRDLALRGARALRAEREEQDWAQRFLADELTADHYDFSVAKDLHERR